MMVVEVEICLLVHLEEEGEVELQYSFLEVLEVGVDGLLLKIVAVMELRLLVHMKKGKLGPRYSLPVVLEVEGLLHALLKMVVVVELRLVVRLEEEGEAES
jgi:hypothetical protein